jgi:hypothetical protein
MEIDDEDYNPGAVTRDIESNDDLSDAFADTRFDVVSEILKFIRRHINIGGDIEIEGEYTVGQRIKSANALFLFHDDSAHACMWPIDGMGLFKKIHNSAIVNLPIKIEVDSIQLVYNELIETSNISKGYVIGEAFVRIVGYQTFHAMDPMSQLVVAESIPIVWHASYTHENDGDAFDEVENVSPCMFALAPPFNVEWINAELRALGKFRVKLRDTRNALSERGLIIDLSKMEDTYLDLNETKYFVLMQKWLEAIKRGDDSHELKKIETKMHRELGKANAIEAKRRSVGQQ